MANWLILSNLSPQVPTLLIIVSQSLALHRSSKASTSLIKVLAVLISDLTTALATTVLPALLEPWIKIGTDDTLVKLRATHILHAVECILVSVVLDEAEATWRLGEAVKTHDEALDLTAFAEELVNLFFGSVE